MASGYWIIVVKLIISIRADNENERGRNASHLRVCESQSEISPESQAPFQDSHYNARPTLRDRWRRPGFSRLELL